MTYRARQKSPKYRQERADAICCTSVNICKQITLFAKQFLRQTGVELLESKRRFVGSYGIGEFTSNSETATKMLVAGGCCTARKTLCI